MDDAMRLSRMITAANREELVAAVQAAPIGAMLELIDVRTSQQNRLMWALLADVSDQLRIGGEAYEPDDWKCAFMKALGYELRWMPALDGKGVVACGYRSSRLEKETFSELIELIYAEGAQRGVVFRGDQGRAPP